MTDDPSLGRDFVAEDEETLLDPDTEIDITQGIIRNSTLVDVFDWELWDDSRSD